MVPRRRNRVLAGLGEGLSNVSGLLLRTHLQDRLQDRYDRRQAENQKAMDARAATAADRASAVSLLGKVGTGDTDPIQAAATLSMLLGEPIDPSSLESVRPSPRRRMEKAVGGKIDSAKLPEDVPDDASILSAGRMEGREIPQDWLAQDAMTDVLDPFAGFSGEVGELRDRASARRRALENAPTEKITGTDPTTNAPYTQMVSRSQLTKPMTTGPTAKQAGVFEGQKEESKINTAGGAMAAQAGREAGAAARAKLAAELEQGGITGQQQQAALALADDYQKQSSVFTDTKNAVSNIVTLAQRITSQRAAGKDAPAAHIGLIFNFMKMQDPGSTVREGEQAMAANAAGVDERVRNLYNSLIKGGRLSPEQVTDFTTTASDVYRQRAAAQASLEKDFTQRATTMRVPPQLVTGYVSALANPPETDADRKARERRGGQ